MNLIIVRSGGAIIETCLYHQTANAIASYISAAKVYLGLELEDIADTDSAISELMDTVKTEAEGSGYEFEWLDFQPLDQPEEKETADENVTRNPDRNSVKTIIVDALGDAEFTSPSCITDEIINFIEDLDVTDKDSISIAWTIGDVHQQAEENGIPWLTDEHARGILQYLEKKYDANYGITWGHVSIAINFYIQEHQLTPPLEITGKMFQYKHKSGRGVVSTKNGADLFQWDNETDDDDKPLFTFVMEAEEGDTWEKARGDNYMRFRTSSKYWH